MCPYMDANIKQKWSCLWLSGSGNPSTIASIVAFGEVVLAARAWILRRYGECTHTYTKKIPADTSPNSSIPGVLIRLVSLQRSIEEWWGRAPHKMLILNVFFNRHGFDRVKTWLALSSCVYQISTIWLFYSCFHDLVYNSYENSVYGSRELHTWYLLFGAWFLATRVRSLILKWYICSLLIFVQLN